MFKQALIVTTALTLFALFVLANSWEYQDRQREEQRYCDMVKLNLEHPGLGWPHYNKSINCNNGEAK